MAKAAFPKSLKIPTEAPHAFAASPSSGYLVACELMPQRVIRVGPGVAITEQEGVAGEATALAVTDDGRVIIAWNNSEETSQVDVRNADGSLAHSVAVPASYPQISLDSSGERVLVVTEKGVGIITLPTGAWSDVALPQGHAALVDGAFVGETILVVTFDKALLGGSAGGPLAAISKLDHPTWPRNVRSLGDDALLVVFNGNGWAVVDAKGAVLMHGDEMMMSGCRTTDGFAMVSGKQILRVRGNDIEKKTAKAPMSRIVGGADGALYGLSRGAILTV